MDFSDPAAHTTAQHPADHIARAGVLTHIHAGLGAVRNDMIPDLAIATRVLADPVAIEAAERALELGRELADQLAGVLERESAALRLSYDQFHAVTDEKLDDELPPIIQTLIEQLNESGVDVEVHTIGFDSSSVLKGADELIAKAKEREQAFSADETTECPLTCLNRLAPQCVIHRPAVEDD